MPQALLHEAIAFNPQSRHSYHVHPAILWDLKDSPDHYARHSSAPDRRLSSRILAQPATNPPLAYFRITSELFANRDWMIEIRNANGVTVGDVLRELHRGLRHRISSKEWARVPHQHKARVAEAFYERTRRSHDPQYEYQAGVRRIDWLLKSTSFVGLTPSLERSYTWTLTVKRSEK